MHKCKSAEKRHIFHENNTNQYANLGSCHCYTSDKNRIVLAGYKSFGLQSYQNLASDLPARLPQTLNKAVYRLIRQSNPSAVQLRYQCSNLNSIRTMLTLTLPTLSFTQLRLRAQFTVLIDQFAQPITMKYSLTNLYDLPTQA